MILGAPWLWNYKSMGDSALGSREQAAEGGRLDLYFEYLGNSGSPGAWHSGRNGETLQSVINSYCSALASLESRDLSVLWCCGTRCFPGNNDAVGKGLENFSSPKDMTLLSITSLAGHRITEW